MITCFITLSLSERARGYERECWRTDGVIGRSREGGGGWKRKAGTREGDEEKSGGMRQQSEWLSSFHTICLSTGGKCFVPNQKNTLWK